MSRNLSREFKRVTIEKRGRDAEVRVPQFNTKLKGGRLLLAIGHLAMETASHNYRKSCSLMEDWFRADHTLYMRTQDLRLLCKSTIDGIRRATRGPMKAAAIAPSSLRMDGIVKSAAKSLMGFALRNGLVLGDATKADLQLSESEDRKKATTMIENANWFALIKKQLPDDKTKVREVLQEADLIRLLKNAQKVAA